MITLKDEFDFEKDHLVIARKQNGEFHSFSWHDAEKTDTETLKERIIKANKNNQNEEYGLLYELITEKLARELCAYREHGKPLVRLVELANDAKASVGSTIQLIRNAVEYLDDAERILDKIEGVD